MLSYGFTLCDLEVWNTYQLFLMCVCCLTPSDTVPLEKGKKRPASFVFPLNLVLCLTPTQTSMTYVTCTSVLDTIAPLKMFRHKPPSQPWFYDNMQTLIYGEGLSANGKRTVCRYLITSSLTAHKINKRLLRKPGIAFGQNHHRPRVLLSTISA